MSLNPSNAQKFVNVQEVAAEPVHVPIVVNNENFIVSQVDVRRIVDTRHIIFNRILPTGELLPLQQLDPSFQQNLMNTFRLVQKLLPDHCFNEAGLRDFIRRFMETQALKVPSQEQQRMQLLFQQLQQQPTSPIFSCPIAPLSQLQHLQVHPQSTISPASTILPLFTSQSTTAPIQQLSSQSQPSGFDQVFAQLKLQWNNQNDSKPLFPLHHTQATSTTEMRPLIQQHRKSKSTLASELSPVREVSVGASRSQAINQTIEPNLQKQTQMGACSTIQTQTIGVGSNQTSTEMQTTNPSFHNISAQTPRTQLVQAQTSTYNMADTAQQSLPPSLQTQSPNTSNSVTPMAVPMMAASKSRSLPLGISNT